jgi:DNA polymerase
MMHTLSIDIETYSSTDLLKCGVYRYAESKDFEVLLFAYALDDEPVQVVDLTKDELPDTVEAMLLSPWYTKAAFNANFERTCLSRMLGVHLPPEQWKCTAVHAATLGLPRSLADVGAALGLPEDKQKMKEGKDLIRYFCVPCKPTKKNKGRTRNLPEHDPEKWATFIEYNRRDVETEREIRKLLETHPVPDEDWEAYFVDQHINDAGIGVDMPLVDSAIDISNQHNLDLAAEAGLLTGLDNVKSMPQLKGWLGHSGTLDKKVVKEMRESGNLDGDTDRVLEIRQELGKSSVSKYEAIKRSVCQDGRVRGLFAYYGANRTGRWAGRLVQVQNLPQNHIPDLDAARQVVKDGDHDGLQALYGNVASTLSELIRTAFVPREGHTFCVADFSAIEARVVAWLADEQWRQDLFAAGGKIYEASAERMFHLPPGSVKKGDPMRQKGKIAELALGYGGGPGAMKAMGALEMGLQEDELQPIVTAWREANPAIVSLWWLIDNAARDTVRNHRESWRCDLPHGMSMRMSRKMLHILLPSGRELRYWKPRLETDEYGREVITYGGMDAGRWGRCNTYGPKLVENIVQATARDCLRDAMLRMHADLPGQIVMHVHDEVVMEVPLYDAEYTLESMLEIMKTPIPWAKGLILKGDGYTCDFYKKD